MMSLSLLVRDSPSDVTIRRDQRVVFIPVVLRLSLYNFHLMRIKLFFVGSVTHFLVNCKLHLLACTRSREYEDGGTNQLKTIPPVAGVHFTKHHFRRS